MNSLRNVAKHLLPKQQWPIPSLNVVVMLDTSGIGLSWVYSSKREVGISSHYDYQNGQPNGYSVYQYASGMASRKKWVPAKK